MHRGFMTSLPISPKIARERSVLFAIEPNSDGLLSVRSPSDWSAIASTGDSNSNTAATFAGTANGSKLVTGFLVIDAVTAPPAVGSVAAGLLLGAPNIAIARV